MTMLHNSPPEMHRLCASGLGRSPLAPGASPAAATVDALQRLSGCVTELLDCHEHALHAGARARAAAYLELSIERRRTLFGGGLDAHIVTASIKAVVSALQRCGITFESPAPVAQPFAGAHHG